MTLGSLLAFFVLCVDRVNINIFNVPSARQQAMSDLEEPVSMTLIIIIMYMWESGLSYYKIFEWESLNFELSWDWVVTNGSTLKLVFE